MRRLMAYPGKNSNVLSLVHDLLRESAYHAAMVSQGPKDESFSRSIGLFERTWKLYSDLAGRDECLRLLRDTWQVPKYSDTAILKLTPRIYRLQTLRGKYYDVRERDGAIKRLDQADFQFSTSWTCCGLRHVRRRSEFIPLADLRSFPSNAQTMLYKNGKNQYVVCDNDHGTYREWGDGLVSITDMGPEKI